MYYIIGREETNNIMSMPGEVSGEVLRKDRQYIAKRGGKKKVIEAEEEMADLGHSFSYEKISKKNFYPWGTRVLSLFAIASVFKLEKTKIKELGKKSLNLSTCKKLRYRYLKSTEEVLKELCGNWRKSNTVGRIELKEINEKEKKAVVTLYNLDFHPIFCDYFCGILSKLVETSEGKKADCKETMCYFNGDCDYHQFIITWY